VQAFGHLLLIVVFFTTMATALTAYYGAVTRNNTLVRGARYGVYANVFVYLAMAVVLWHGLYAHDYLNKYIATYTDNEMPLIYLFTSFWGGEKGALLLWAMVLNIFSAIAVHHAREKDVSYLGYATGILMTAVIFFNILMVFESNPFETVLTDFGPEDGRGMNPLLQTPEMSIHPPSLLTGYIAFTVPFAFGAAALITGRLDEEWATDTRKWTIVSWLFLTTGLILGGAWAYQELGWGGFWMWDPVENAGLIPWFTATAFLHSIIVQERRRMLRRWNFTLVCLTFLLTIFGTFLTRSQLIVSIHSFADSQLADYFLYYMFFIAAVSAALLIWRWRALKAPERIQSFMSKEAFFVLNNLALVICAFIVIWGTVYPKVSEWEVFRGLYNGVIDFGNKVTGAGFERITEAQNLGEDWFNMIMVPFGLVLLFLMALGPLVAWRRMKVRTDWTLVGGLVAICIALIVSKVTAKDFEPINLSVLAPSLIAIAGVLVVIPLIRRLLFRHSPERTASAAGGTEVPDVSGSLSIQAGDLKTNIPTKAGAWELNPGKSLRSLTAMLFLLVLMVGSVLYLAISQGWSSGLNEWLGGTFGMSAEWFAEVGGTTYPLADSSLIRSWEQVVAGEWMLVVMWPSVLIMVGLMGVAVWGDHLRSKATEHTSVFAIPYMMSLTAAFLGVGAFTLMRIRRIRLDMLLGSEGIEDGTTVTAWDGLNAWSQTIVKWDVYAVLCIWLCLFVFIGTAMEFWRGGRIRQRRRGGGMAGNMATLTLKAKRRYVGYIIHVGAALAFLGIAGGAFTTTTPETPLHIGETIECAGYQLTYVGMRDSYHHGKGFAASGADVIVLRDGETVPSAEVERVADAVQQLSSGPFHVQTRLNSPKIELRFDNDTDRSRVQEALYIHHHLLPVMEVDPSSSGNGQLAFGFRDKALIQMPRGVGPMTMRKYFEEFKSKFAAISGKGVSVRLVQMKAKAGAPRLLVSWTKRSDFERVSAIVQAKEAPIDDILMVRSNPLTNALEIVTARTGHLLQPEIRFYRKHTNPTTEVAIWSRWSEDVYLAIRPTPGTSVIQLLSVVNPMVSLLWLGTVIMFIGGVTLLFPTRLLANAFQSKRRTKAVVATSVVLAVLGLVSSTAISAPVDVVARSTVAAPVADSHAEQLLSVMRCACQKGGQLVFSTTDPPQTLKECECPAGVAMKARVLREMALASDADKESKRAQLAFLERIWKEDRSNERYVIYPRGEHTYLMQNTKCTCGCGDMVLARCPLDCPWAPVFKRKFKNLLALGFSPKEAQEYYVGQANRVHRKGKKPLEVESIIQDTGDQASNLVPILVAVGAVVIIAFVFWSRSRTNRQRMLIAQSPSVHGGEAGSVPQQPPELNDLDRELLNDELDDVGG
jgi:c-type cytochrome biogenesis protein CcmF